MKLPLVLLGALLLAPCRVPAQADTVPILGIVAPSLADSAWAYAQACSGLKPQSGFPLSRVHWYVADLIAHSPHHDTIGLWNAPDSIVLDLRFANDFTTITHELLHYLRQEGGHPRVPFLVPCRVANPEEIDK
jgi:hypothetical protein